ncbi:bifunctional 4-hydroxy-2-oxoglutarate aldolase/2-dehydro-3-deoxy-phosphogluconate aldolase [Leucobacter allii]|uniref:2-dehydro-3-deoxy-phosphogluconate aldolase n=1 Tax=Leucobacter allii TaxID=2932247 RepID=A0ABY4FNL9_9MICO|nr:bifunctional 4-hydroxy-2-oxoglutarate aldolase/2-dehydro-3-deoxy-phosphogluconate aldolase [Leucobacter allii]UOQ57873.1 bifunctional 4-hydroxy-2-oxoglutarate aldolase/2-dehydro-3-deoxy-phosphogluconate aldolase [Leucobacter allii]
MPTRRDAQAELSATARALLSGNRVVPVIEIDDPAQAVPLTRALAAGGITIVEITFRTSAGADAVRAAASGTDSIVGAGTLLTPSDVDAAADAGAAFGVSPGWDPLTAARALERGLLVIPGVTGAGEIQQRLAEGHTTVKFFPAEANGGAAALAQLSAPFAHTGLSFMPTGGIGAHNAASYLAIPAVTAIGGSWVAPRALVAAGEWAQITALAAGATAALSTAGA